MVAEMSRKAKTPTLEEAVAAIAVAAPLDDLADALGELVKRRLCKPQPQPMSMSPSAAHQAYRQQRAAQRAKPRRVGKLQRYTVTGKWNDARFGTFRHYMIRTIIAHTDTRAADAAHATCDNPKFAKNKLDFRWAADNGYITLD